VDTLHPHRCGSLERRPHSPTPSLPTLWKTIPQPRRQGHRTRIRGSGCTWFRRRRRRSRATPRADQLRADQLNRHARLGPTRGGRWALCRGRAALGPTRGGRRALCRKRAAGALPGAGVGWVGSVRFFGDDLGAEGFAEQVGVGAGVVFQHHVVLADCVRFFLGRQWHLRSRRGLSCSTSLLCGDGCFRGTALTRGLLSSIRGCLPPGTCGSLPRTCGLLRRRPRNRPVLPRIRLRGYVVF
jgi:hypothetical protein